MGPPIKKQKTDEDTPELPQCKHFVVRKKRYCKMTVAKGKEYCGEHEPQTTSTDGIEATDEGRIPCPLDSKHSIYKKNLRKHLKICNARPGDLPLYIVPGINCGDDCDTNDTETEHLKLCDVPKDELKQLIDKVNRLYTQYVDGQIQDMKHSHKVLCEELGREYGFETKKHLTQTASLLGCIDANGLFKDATSFIEFGAGKGQLSYWLAQVLAGLDKSQVILIDRMSHRHKKDNKIEDRDAVHRIRADIGDLKMSELEILKNSKSIVAVSKHLCGAATDLAIRCILQTYEPRTDAVLIALCCHHRCEWKSFVGKEFFLTNGLSRKDFVLITKLASWAVCGTGFSRQRGKEFEAEDNKVELFSLKEREDIGLHCKRVLDYSRVEYLRRNGYKVSLNFYVDKDITLENVCIFASREKTQ